MLHCRTLLFSLFFLKSLSLLSQDFDVYGRVSGSDEPLIGATIIVKETELGTVSDVSGEFNITVQKGATLEVSYLGFISQQFIITEKTALEINLSPNTNIMDEVVLIGYGSVKKSDLTGSVSSLKSKDFTNTVVSSLDQGLQGKVAGMVVNMSSGQPGSPSSVRIRGTNSINGNNEPLYVIDGVFIVPETNVGAVSGPSLNPLSNINPDDIESIEVLKDASATAIYGTRGANGVIIVTTKRGEKGSTQINFNYSHALQQIRHKIPLLNASQLANLGNEATDNAGAPRRLIYASPVNLGIGTDWQDEIFRTAAMDNLQISVRGGSEKTNYSLSANYFNQNGIIKQSNYKKGNLRINLDHEIHEKFSIGTSLNLTRNFLKGVVTDSEGAIPSSVTSWALAFNPGLDVFDSKGEYTFENNTSQPAVGNPVADLYNTDQFNSSTRLLGNVFFDWKIIEDLTLHTSVGTDAVTVTEKSFVPNDIKRGQGTNGQAALANQQGINWLIETNLTYIKQFGKHRIIALLGYSPQAYKNEFLFTATSDFDDNRLGYNALQVGADKTLIFNGASGWQLESYLGRLNYNLSEKYLITASARIDGASKFGEGNKYGVFPSFAFAWRVNQEDFLKSSSTINDLKLRIGYGKVGNEGIPPYSSLGLLETTEAYFGENEIAKGAGPATRPNSTLKWETTSQFDLGLDLGLYDNRLSVVMDLYYKKTTDLLLNAPVPYTSGFAFSFFNVGSLENRGLEIALNTINVLKPIRWNTSFNIAFNRNKVLKLNSDEGIPADPLLGINGWSEINEGSGIGTFYGYKKNGIIQLSDDLNSIPYFQDYNPTYGDRKYVDKNNDGILDESDKFILGNANPDFSYGMNNSVEYRALSFSFFIQGVYGNKIVNFNKFSLESFDGNQNNSTAALDRWSPNNPSDVYPRANVSPRINTLSDHQVEDGSYLRVKDITLSYDLKNLLAKRSINIRSLLLFASAKNIITITDYSGFDPEVNRFINNPRSFGADYGSYPSAKIYSVGLNVKL